MEIQIRDDDIKRYCENEMILLMSAVIKKDNHLLYIKN